MVYGGHSIGSRQSARRTLWVVSSLLFCVNDQALFLGLRLFLGWVAREGTFSLPLFRSETPANQREMPPDGGMLIALKLSGTRYEPNWDVWD